MVRNNNNQDQSLDPYYVHSSDNSTTVTITPQLTGENYHSWSMKMQRALAMKNAIDKVSTYLAQVVSVVDTKNYDEDKSFTMGEVVTELSVAKTIGFDDNSWVYLDYDPNVSSNNVSVTKYSFKITEGDYTFIIERNSDGKPYIANQTTLSPKAPALSNEFLNNIASYDTMEIVYYNPIDGVKCNASDYNSNNSIAEYKGVVSETNTLGQTECLKWYKYSTNIDGTVNMILDHNIEIVKKYYSSRDNSYGPVDLMEYLTLSEWEGVPTRGDKYIAYVDDGTTKTVIFTNAVGNAISYTGKKARLITAQEVAEITGATSAISPGISWNEQSTSSRGFYLDSKDQSTARSSSNPSDYYWLFENLSDCSSYGCSPIGDDAHIQPGNSYDYGYWTSSPGASSSSTAWFVYNYGRLETSYPEYNIKGRGIRPVITIPIS